MKRFFNFIKKHIVIESIICIILGFAATICSKYITFINFNDCICIGWVLIVIGTLSLTMNNNQGE